MRATQECRTHSYRFVLSKEATFWNQKRNNVRHQIEFILECFVKPSITFNALNSSRLVEATDRTTNVIRLSDGIQYEASISIRRIDRYCHEVA